MRYPVTLEAILERSEPEPNSGCWLWMHKTDRQGYPIAKRNRKEFRVHRASYEAAHGVIPSGLFVCHRCNCPSCVNPVHLYLATNAGNLADAARDGLMVHGDQHWTRRHRGNSRPWTGGEHHWKARLTWEQVHQMRIAYAHGETIRQLAERYRVHYDTAYAAIHGLTWKD